MLARRKSIKYPDIRKDDKVIDDYFGTPIADPYRWLENVNSVEVQNFIDAQNQLTDEYLRKSPATACNGEKGAEGDVDCGDGGNHQIRERIRARLKDLWTYCDYNCPFKRGDHYFYFKDGTLYMLQPSVVENCEKDCNGQSKSEEGQMILDPNSVTGGFLNEPSLTTSKGIFIGNENYGNHLVFISNDGNVLAYGVSEGSSVWTSIHFKNLTSSGEKYEKDVLQNVRRETYLSWTRCGEGLFYDRYMEKALNYKHAKIFYHKLGTPQTQDKLLLEFNLNPNWELTSKVSDCGEFLLIYVDRDCGPHTKIYLCHMEEIMDHVNSTTKTKLPPPTFTPIVRDFHWNYNYITNVGPIFYFLTNKHAPNSKVVRVDVTNENQVLKTDWPSVVKEHKKLVLDWAACVKENFLFTCYIQRAQSNLQLRTLNEGALLYQFRLGLGTVTEHCGLAQDAYFFFKFSSFLEPGKIYRVDLESLELAIDASDGDIASCCSCSHKGYKFQVPLHVFRESSLPSGFNPDNYEVNQIFYTSKDRTKVSMFLVHKKNLVRNGQNPCILRGDGGFYASLKPDFDPTYLLFMEHFNGVYAVANIRGGSEYGGRWYENGIRMKKQNSFDDFQYAAKYLIRTKYTCPEKLTIRGDSNGGLLVAACINQKPELFGAAIIEYGVSDLLRFHNFSSGRGWTIDYGSSEEEHEFKNLLKLSPLHNVRLPQKSDAQYPATLFITAKKDEIVMPFHTYKMLAQLQATIGGSLQQKNPLLMRVDPIAGHFGVGMSIDTELDKITDILSFIKFSLNLKFNEQHV